MMFKEKLFRLKKYLAAILVAAAIVCGLLLTACGGDGGENLSGSMRVVVDNQNDDVAPKIYEVDLSAFTTEDSAEAVLNALVENQGLFYEGSRGAFGLMLTAVGYRYVPEGSEWETNCYLVRQDVIKGEYVYLYTSVAKDEETSEYKREVSFDGMTLVSSSVGISSMHVEDGAVIFIGMY